jgi:hypothetical protein
MPFSPTALLYRRILRISSMLNSVPLKKRTAYNAREVIALYASAPSSAKERLIEQGHRDLDIWEALLTRGDPQLLGQLLQSFHRQPATNDL